MEVLELEPDRVFATLIQDGPMQIRGRTLFEATGEDQTRLTMQVELPGMDESADMSFLAGRMERSIEAIRRLIESET